MKINSTGVTKSSLSEYLGFWTNKLREVYGNDFVIRKEGVVDNLATASSLTNMALEDVLLYLIKNMNPHTAEGEFQDILYSLVGLQRLYASYTTVTRTISGVAGTICETGSIRFKNSATEDIFELNSAVTIGENGTAVGSFTAIELGAIDLEPEALLSIVDAPNEINGVYYSVEDNNTTILGDDYEDDSEFRLRWLATNSAQRNSNTEGGLRVALLPLVGNNANNLKIRQNRNRVIYDDLPLHSMNIILKSAESDEKIAETIFNNIVDGNLAGLVGNIKSVVKDSENQEVDIYFDRAVSVPMYFRVQVVLKNNVFLTQIERKIREAIVNNFSYNMGERIIANDFYQYINSIEGIDYVSALEVTDTENSGYKQTQMVDYFEYGTVIADNIIVEEA